MHLDKLMSTRIVIINNSNGKVYRYNLPDKFIESITKYTRKLPTHEKYKIYSCGYYERITDSEWGQLPFLDNIIFTEISSTFSVF